MPIYEYMCPSCNTTFEEWVRSATDAHSDHCACPNCKAEAQRMMSPSTFILKGGGWYVTEYGAKTANTNDKDQSNHKSAETNNVNTPEKDSVKKADDKGHNAEKQSTSSSTETSNANNTSSMNKAEAKTSASAAHAATAKTSNAASKSSGSTPAAS